MVVAAEALRRTRCACAATSSSARTPTRSRAARRRSRARATASSRRLRDRAGAVGPRGLAGVPGQRLLRPSSCRGRAGHAEQEHAHFARAAARSTRSRRRSYLLDGVDRLRLDWRSRPESHHPLLPPPDIVCTALRRRRGLDRHDPEPRDADAGRADPARARPTTHGWTSDVQRGGRGVPAPLVRRRPVARRAPADVRLAHGGEPVRDAASTRASVRALLGANAALGLPLTLGGLGSWYDGATFALEARDARADVRPAAHRLGAHGRRVRADRRPRALRAGHRGRRAPPLRLTSRRLVRR